MDIKKGDDMDIIETLRRFMLETDDELERAIYQATIVTILTEEKR